MYFFARSFLYLHTSILNVRTKVCINCARDREHRALFFVIYVVPQVNPPWFGFFFSITTAILWTRQPPLVHLCTIEPFFAQPLVHVVMPSAQPCTKRLPATDVWRVLLEVLTQVRGAVGAGVCGGEGCEEGEHLGFVCRTRIVRVVCCGGVEECPCCAAELFNVDWALG